MKNMKTSRFPKGWDEESVCQILTHYESQTEEEAVAEDEAAYETCAKRASGSERLIPETCISVAPGTQNSCHSRESGNPVRLGGLDSRFRGNDENLAEVWELHGSKRDLK